MDGWRRVHRMLAVLVSAATMTAVTSATPMLRAVSAAMVPVTPEAGSHTARASSNRLPGTIVSGLLMRDATGLARAR